MKVKNLCLLVFTACSMALSAGELIDTPLNLLKEGKFQPIHMHGMVTAAKGWGMHDHARDYSMRQKRKYLSGEDCFTLSYQNDAFSIVFKNPLPEVYKNHSVLLRSRMSALIPPAAHYVYKGRLKFKNARLLLSPEYQFKASDEWQEFEIKRKVGFAVFVLWPEAGAEFHFDRMEVFAKYPEIGGSIALPDGGKLEKILIPENATYEMRHGVTLWRGWLWRLTGVALPIVTVKEVTGPVKGALAAVRGPEKPGNWSLKVDKNGIFISSYCDLEISNALFDYLRRGLGCAFYQRDCQKIPKMGSVKQLTALDFTTKLMYTHFNCWSTPAAWQGGDDDVLLYTRNDVDYYHLPGIKNDHIFNILVPQERYFKTNPEYFAKIDKDSYYVHANAHYTNHCLTNPELRELVIKNALEYVKNQNGPRRLVIDEGDSPIHCQCENCVKYNKGTTSCSNSVYSLHEELAKRIAEVRPDLIFERHAYYTRMQMPDNIKKLPDNCHIFYCIGFPCTLHVECEANRKALDLIKQLRTLVNDDPRRMSLMHYGDLRPLYMIKQMKELNKYGSDSFFLWVYKSFHPAIPFVLGRYNLGEDPMKLLKEFEEAYYGKGAPHIHRAFEIAEEFAENYKHTPAEVRARTRNSIWPDTFGSINTILDRKTLDRIYQCFDKALKATINDKLSRKHVYRDLLFFLVEDLHKFRPFNCRSDAEFKAYVDRLALLVRAGREFPGAFDKLMLNTEARVFIATVTGLNITRRKRNWADEPILDAVLRDPGKYLVRNGEIFPGGGLYFRPVFFSSNFENTVDIRPEVKVQGKQRDNMLLYQTQTMEMTLPAGKINKHPVALSIEAVKQSGSRGYSIEVAVNGHNVYSGPVTYSDDKWSRMGFSIPAGALKQGDNKLTVKNTSSDGWIAVSEIYTIDVSGDFQNHIRGASSLWAALLEGDKVKGTARGGNGKSVVEAPAGYSLPFYFFGHKHDYPKISVTPGGRIRVKVTASGTGKIRLAVFRYTSYGVDKNGVQQFNTSGYLRHVGNSGPSQSRAFDLTEKPQSYSYEFKLPSGVGLVFPGVIVEGGRAEITDVSVLLKQPKQK